MPIPAESHFTTPGALRLWLQGIGVLVGPLTWLAALSISYFRVEVYCHVTSDGSLVTGFGVAALVVAGAGACAAAAWALSSSEPAPSRERSRFLGKLGVALALASLLALGATAAPLLLLGPCDG
jgi:hypothetical protein